MFNLNKNDKNVSPVAQDQHNDNGFCPDMAHPCHENQENINRLNEQYQDGEASLDDVTRLYHGLRGAR